MRYLKHGTGLALAAAGFGLMACGQGGELASEPPQEDPFAGKQDAICSLPEGTTGTVSYYERNGEQYAACRGPDGEFVAHSCCPELAEAELLESLIAELDGPRVELQSGQLWVRANAGADLRTILEISAETSSLSTDPPQGLTAAEQTFACAWNGQEESVCRVQIDAWLDDLTADVEEPMAVEFEGEGAWTLRNWLEALPSDVRYERPFGCQKRDIFEDANQANNYCYVRKAPYGYLEATDLALTMQQSANDTPRDMFVERAGMSAAAADAIESYRSQTGQFDTLSELASLDEVTATSFEKLAQWLQ